MELNVLDFVNNVDTRLIEQGAEVFSAGTPSDGTMFFVLEGELEAVTDSGKQETVVKRYQRGDFFGEMALINNSPRSHTVRALSKGTKLGRIDKDIFMRISRSNPVFLYRMLIVMITRLAEVEKQVVAASNQVNENIRRFMV